MPISRYIDQKDFANAIVEQSYRPVLLGSYVTSAAAGIIPIQPFSTDLVGGAGLPMIVSRGQRLIAQCTTTMNIRCVGAGTVAASGTVTYSGASAGQTITVCGRICAVFTATGVAATDAALAVAALNADPFFSAPIYGFVASASAGVVTITSKVKGAGGNAFTLAAGGVGATASGAVLASGAGPTAATSGTNAYFIATANAPYPFYLMDGDLQLDVKGTGAGTLQLFM